MSRVRFSVVASALISIAGIAEGGCSRREASPPADEKTMQKVAALSVDVSALLAELRARIGAPLPAGIADRFDPVEGGLRPSIPAAAGAVTARVVLPERSTGAFHIEDAATGAAIDVSLQGARDVVAAAGDGYVVYPGGHSSGATVIQRPEAEGTEEFLDFATRPDERRIAYTVAINPTVAGLRLVAGTLEFLDAAGAPRLRVPPPYVVGSDGERADAPLAVEGCSVDTNPAAPWGRPVTNPGAATCTVAVTWPDRGVSYPALLDPRWITTGSMITARHEHTLTLIVSTGKVLAAGGRSSTGSTTALSTAELYDKNTGVWSSTGSFSGGRRLHGAVQLNTSGNSGTSGKILVAGGISGSTSVNTARLYSPSGGSWTSAGNLNAARHGFTSTLLADGRVLAAGGLNGTTTLQTAAIYNPTSGSGSWTATTGPIPPPGLKNHTATLIQTSNSQLNNKVLLVGGNSGSGTISAVYLFDPAQSAFSTLASLSSARELHTAGTVPGANGKILVAGGKNGGTVLGSAIVFDPGFSNGSWSPAGNMTTPRVGHSMTVLPQSIVANGSMLLAGGSSTGSNTLGSAELFSDTATWTATASLPGPMQGHQTLVLGNNMVLAAGGLSSSSTVVTATYLYDASFGLGCSSGGQCPSGQCVSGVCCDTACTGGCGACNLAGHLGTCWPRATGTTCRASAGDCDVAELCNGASLVCPSDGKLPNGTACTDDGNACTTDVCNGSSVSCQHFAGNAGAVCRAAADECDVADTCIGSSTTCPSDGKKPSGTPCTDDGNACTTDTCNGSAISCQHPPGNAGTGCRASAGVCDLAETCSGSSITCPADTFAAAGTVCRAATAPCDAVETCTGTTATCPADSMLSDGATCNDGNACTQTDSCQAGACVGNNPALMGVPESDPSSPTCIDGSSRIGCRGYECATGLPTAVWLATPTCGPSYPACVAACPAAGCSQADPRSRDLVTCSCSCIDPTGGSPFSVDVNGCGTQTSATCNQLCARANAGCETVSSCALGACQNIQSQLPTIVLANACRLNDTSVVPTLSDYVAVVDSAASSLTISVGSTTTSVPVSGTLGFQFQIPSEGDPQMVLGAMSLASNPFSFFGRSFSTPRFNTTNQPGVDGTTLGSGQYGFTFPTGSFAGKVGAVENGAPRAFDLVGTTPLQATLNLAARRIEINSSATLPSGDSAALHVLANIPNLPPQAAHVHPGALVECNQMGGAAVTLDGTPSTDPEGQALRYQWFYRFPGSIDSTTAPLTSGQTATATLPYGPNFVSLTVSDPQLAASRSEFSVTVRDTAPPTLPALPTVMYHAGAGNTSRLVTLNVPDATDVCDAAPNMLAFLATLAGDGGQDRVPIDPAEVVLQVGSSTIIWQATDAAGNVGEATQNVEVLASGSPDDDPPPDEPATCATPLNLPGPDTVDVDLRLCVVGRIEAGERVGNQLWRDCPAADGGDATDTCFGDVVSAANVPFAPSVNFKYKGWKRIRDTVPNSGYGRDFIGALFSGREFQMIDDCYAAWGVPRPGGAGFSPGDPCTRGVVVVVVRTSNSVCALTRTSENAVTSNQDSICDGSVIFDKTFNPVVLLGADSRNATCVNPVFTLAHEVGHVLGLPHGDGIDNDCNGLWDDKDLYLCDPLEIDDGPSNLMGKQGGDFVLTQLQRDRARTFALKSVPGVGRQWGDGCPPQAPPPPPDDTLTPPPPGPDGGPGPVPVPTGSCGCDVIRPGLLPVPTLLLCALIVAAMRRRRRL